jgi:GT2 family glycosyltransferase
VFPFFTENRQHNSTLNRDQEGEYDKIQRIQDQSSEFITEWWKENGKNINIKELVSMIDKIPVIGAPVVNSTYWIARLIMSVDYPVENFVIINNNGRGEIDEELDRLTQMDHKYIDNIKVVHMPANIGCAGAWNLIIKCYMLAPYWIIANDDVAFGPGLLKEMVDTLNMDPVIGMIHPNAGDFGIGAWDLFLIRENVVKIFGLFDENTYPAYCEDADYIMRMQHRPIRKVVGLQNKYMHGPEDSTMYYKSGSQTQKNEEGLKEKLDHSNELNIEYLNRKWGPGWRSLSPNFDVFEGEGAPISMTTWDLEFVRQKHMGF